MMKIYDITGLLDENTPVYPGDPAFKKQMVQKDGFMVCKLTMSSHAGTHIDASSHLMRQKPSIKDIPLDKLIGTCAVCSMLTEVYEAIGNGIDKILYKGAEGDLKEIAGLCIGLIGIEGRTVGDYEMHRAFLEKNIVVIEGLVLENVPKGMYLLVALPLKMDLDGSPARVALIETEDSLL